MRIGRVWLLVLLACVPITALVAENALGATPSNGTVSAGHALSWTFAPAGGVLGSTDSFKLTVKLPKPPGTFYAPNRQWGTDYAAVLRIHLTWQGNSPDDELSLSVTDQNGNSVGNDTSAITNNGGDVNLYTLQDPTNETYTVTASNFNGISSTAVPSNAVATLEVVNLAALKEPVAASGAPGFTTYHIPLNLMPPKPEETQVLHGRAFGEPSIGVDPKTNATMYLAGLYTMRGAFSFSSHRPPAAHWKNVSSPLTNQISLDAILDVDRSTGRTLVAQLAGCSLLAYSDNDGTSWTPSAKSCQTPPAADHETIGAGPFAPPLTGIGYPDAVYYCSQNVAYAACALSLDGGNTFHGTSPLYTSAQCFGLHGHVKVAPDGTVYVPNKACGAPECYITTSTATPNCHPGFAVSTDNATTWTVHVISDGHTRYYDTGDPQIGIGAKGTMYFGYGNADGRPMIAACTHRGTECGPSIDVGARFHIQNTEMATVVAGDDNRAAFAFLGSTTPGDDQENNVQVKDSNGKVVNRVSPWHNFMGTWHLYVAVTYDGGKHWTTTDATPSNPVQRGCIEFNTALCPSSRGSDDQRNLLDFNDLTIDRYGRIEAAYTDGCQPDLGPPTNHKTCLVDATRLSGLNPQIQGPAVALQTCGLGLYAKFDSMMKPCAQAAAKQHHHVRHTHHGTHRAHKRRIREPVFTG